MLIARAAGVGDGFRLGDGDFLTGCGFIGARRGETLALSRLLDYEDLLWPGK